MPTYDYRCRACGHEFELFQSMTDPVRRKCPRCEKAALERLIGTGAAVLFKGSGFYQTDYRSESYRKAAAGEKAPGGGDAGANTPSEKGGSAPNAAGEGAKASPGAAPGGGAASTGGGAAAPTPAPASPRPTTTGAARKRRAGADRR